MKKKLAILLVPILILAGGFFLMKVLLSLKEEPQKKPFVQKVKSVDVKEVKLEDIQSRIHAYGRVTSAQPLQIYSEVTGILMPGSISFQPGVSFNKGDILIRIDERQTVLKLKRSKSDLMNALALVLPEIKLDFPDAYNDWFSYFQSIDFNRTIADFPAVTDQKLKLYLSRYNIFNLYFIIKDLEITLSKHTIIAPFRGAITEAPLRVGANARIGSVLGEVINLDRLEVEVPLEVENVRWLDAENEILLTSNQLSGEWKGKLARIGKMVDEKTQTVKIYVSIDSKQDDSLIDGIFFNVSFPGLVIPHSISIPRKVLYNEKYVYLVSDGKLEKREVTIARREIESVIVESGLANGDMVVMELLQGVSPGMPAKALNSGVASDDGGGV